MTVPAVSALRIGGDRQAEFQRHQERRDEPHGRVLRLEGSTEYVLGFLPDSDLGHVSLGNVKGWAG